MREEIFFVINDDLDEVNSALRAGGKVKMIQTVAESVREMKGEIRDLRGDVFAYVVITMP